MTENKHEGKSLYIIGAGGFGRELAWLVERVNSVHEEDANEKFYNAANRYEKWDLKGFIDDGSLWKTTVAGYKAYGGTDYLKEPNEAIWVVAAIGKGSIICAGTIITTDIKIGEHCSNKMLLAV